LIGRINFAENYRIFALKIPFDKYLGKNCSKGSISTGITMILKMWEMK